MELQFMNFCQSGPLKDGCFIAVVVTSAVTRSISAAPANITTFTTTTTTTSNTSTTISTYITATAAAFSLLLHSFQI
jgi:hypothetical protein